MTNNQLDKRILKKLDEKLPYDTQSIRNAISTIKSKYGVTLNAAAKEYARQKKIKVDRWLDQKDLDSWQRIPKNPIKTKTILKNVKKQKQKSVKEYINYDTKDRFVLQHIKEVNICCSNHAYTAAFILCRKIVENLLIDDIILKKYPKERDSIPIYFDKTRNRTKDFSEILKNLNSKKQEFSPHTSILDSLLNKSKVFKDEANKRTHSTYHIVRTLKELDIDNVQDILDMIAILNQKIQNSKNSF